VRKARQPIVLVAGAGTVGLAVAALLATGRCSERLRVQVIEARPVPRWRAEDTDLRVYALSRASQQLLEGLGVWNTVRAARACAYRRMHVWEGDPSGAAQVSFDSADIGEPDLGHIVEDSLLRSVLVDVVAAAPNAELTIGSALGALELGRREVTGKLANGGEVRGTLLVAADGSESPVRGLLDLPVASRSYEQTALVTHVASTLPHRDTAWQRFLPDGPLAFLPLADGRSSVVWSLPTERARSLLAAGDAELAAELQAASAGALGELTVSAPRAGFPLQALHALRYCSSRAALVGDAAHTIHPLAGQGMNLGLLDAACLAAVIEDAVLAGEDPGDLKVLRRYERQRKGDNLQMLLALDGLHRLFGLPAWAAPLRAAGLRAVDSSGAAKRLLMQRALGLNAGSKNRLRWSHAP
jgi:ubiquinone biosynthesis UbiH/UbiF/VisC/COQ6 family hydroxylase